DGALRRARPGRRYPGRPAGPVDRLPPPGAPLSRRDVAAVARHHRAAARHHGRALHGGRLSRQPDPRPALDHVGRRGCRDRARRAQPGARHRPLRRRPRRHAAARARARPEDPVSGDSRLNPVVRWTFYLLVCSIPFEFPDRSFPVEIPTLTASLFLFATLLDPRACYARKPAALLCFVAYLYAYWLSVALNGRAHIATDMVTSDHWGPGVTRGL